MVNTSQKFKYLDIYKQIKNDLINGKYPAGTTLPTENELVEIYDASKTTVRHATRMLIDEGYIETKQGSGTIVLNFSNYSSRKKYQNKPKIDISIETDGPGLSTNVGGYIEVINADEKRAKKLNTSVGSKIYRIEWLNLIDGRAFGYNITYLKGELFHDLEEIRFRPRTDFYEYLKKEFQLNIVKMQDEYSAAVPETKYAVQLGITKDTPVMQINRTGYCSEGIFMYSESFVRPDIYKMVITMDDDYFGTKL